MIRQIFSCSNETDFFSESIEQDFEPINETTDELDECNNMQELVPISGIVNEYDGFVTENKKRKTNKCVCFIKPELTRLYMKDELANSRLVGGKRKYKKDSQDTSRLSPGRMRMILHPVPRRV